MAQIKPGDKVLEIGSGPGAITSELLATGAHVFAVEMDRLFSQHLPPHPNLVVHSGDILKFPLETLEKGPWKVVSNLPFHITAPIFQMLFNQPGLFESFTFIVQKEVVNRIKAVPSTKEFGSLTIFLQFYTELKSTFPIPASCFYPKPAVDSTAIHLIPKPPAPIDPDRFFPVVRKAYQQRRKMLTSTLRDVTPPILGLLEELKLNPKARPEELTLENWIDLIRKIDTLQ
jgi:16S rRNA (adenine1518-N6/adenine1519-N6)-dimethyltransferase